MSGILIEQIKKNDFTKKREKTKFFVSLMLSNLFVALLFLGFKSEHSPCINENKINIPTILHPNYKMIIAPLSLLVDRDLNAKETKVSLLNKNKKIIVKTAFLHEEVKNQTKDSLTNTPRFKIEIPEDELINISTDENEVMVAIPEIIEKKNELIKIKKQKASIYEVSL